MTETTHAGATPAPETAEKPAGALRPLYRHPSDRVLSGVCGGVADWLGWDATVVRLLWVVLAFATSGAGFVVYLLLALLLPVGSQDAGVTRRAAIDTRLQSGKPLALLLIGLGVLWLLNNLGILPELSHLFFGALRLFFWPVLLIVIGWRILLALGVDLGNGDALRTQMNDLGTRVSAWGDDVRTATTTATATATATASDHSRAHTASGLWRSRTDRVLLGVCGGIAERYHVDPVLVRLLWVILSVATLGLGAAAYLLAALLLPARELATAAATETGAATPAPADPHAAQEIPVDF